MADLDISLDQILAYLGAEYVHRQLAIERNEELQEEVATLEATIALMAEKVRAQDNSTNSTIRPTG